MDIKDNLPYLKKGQVWKIPIVQGFINGKGVWSNDSGKPYYGFYLLTQKNSNGMWKCVRIWTSPEKLKVNNDQFHNRFMHKSLIVQNGQLVGEEGNMKAIKVLFGQK